VCQAPCVVCLCVQLMERAKVSGSLDLPPELLEVMEHLQQGTVSQSGAGLRHRSSSSSSSMRRSHSAGSSKVR
jgi:hypothetical protein